MRNKIASLLTLLCSLWASLLGASLCQANEEVRTLLASQGYLASETIGQYLRPGSLEELNGLFDEIHSHPFQRCNPTDVHRYATQARWTFTKEEGKLVWNTNGIERLPHVIYDVYKAVLALIPEGDYKVHILLSDDLGQITQKDAVNPLTVGFHQCNHILWHQDKTQDLDYRYLFFMIISASKILALEPNLQLGLARPPGLSTSEAVVDLPNDDVVLEEGVQTAPGAGYLIDQNFQDSDGHVLVHRHRGWTTALIPKDLAENPLLLAQWWARSYPHLTTIQRATFTRVFEQDASVTPARKKLIVRILQK